MAGRGAVLRTTVVLDGVEETLTPRKLREMIGIGHGTATNRIKRFINGELDQEGLFVSGLQAQQNVREQTQEYTREDLGITLTINDIRSVVDLCDGCIRLRLSKWEKGLIDCDTLYAPRKRTGVKKGYVSVKKTKKKKKPKSAPGNKEWDSFRDRPRSNPDAIRITEFERRIGAEMEDAWSRDSVWRKRRTPPNDDTW